MDGGHSSGVTAAPAIGFAAKVNAFRRRPSVAWLLHAIDAIGYNNVLGLASQLAYTFLFSLFPFVLCVVALGSVLPNHDLIDKFLSEVSPFIPASIFQLIFKTAHEVVLTRHAGLLSLGFFLGLWSNSGAISGLMTGLNQVYGVRESRSFLKTRGLILGLTLAVDVLVIVTCLLMAWGGAAGRFISHALGRPDLYSDAWSLMRWPAAVVILFVMMVGIYWILPNVRMRLRDVYWGALLSVLLWIPATLCFSAYLTRFPNFSRTYGSLGAVIVLLTWLWLNGLLLILGGQVNALIAETRKARQDADQKQPA
jgi:membrane protein